MNTIMSALNFPGGNLESKCNDGKTICYGETACMLRNNSYICICYHDGTPPKNGWECIRKTVTPNPLFQLFNSSKTGSDNHELASKPIKVQIPPSDRDYMKHNSSEDVNHILSHEMALPVVLLVGAMLSLLLLTLFCFLKRRTLKRILKHYYSEEKFEDKPNGSNQLNTLIGNDRFIANPTYESTHLMDLAVPVYLQSEINDMVQIGQGCFGKVFKGELNGTLVAVKVVKKEHSDEAMKEVETMATFNHYNILQLLGVARNFEMDAPWLIFEFMEYGDLASLLRSLPSNSFNTGGTRMSSFQCEGKAQSQLELSKESLTDISYQVADGMKYLSSQHFVHRDLAARNCLVSKNGTVKISDFGLSRDVYTCDYYKIGGSRLLPVRWMSPESVLYGRFTLESDIWAYGIMLWEIYTMGKQPYYGHSNEEVVQLILDGVLLCPPSDCPPLICEIMVGCWKSDPKDRFRFPIICEKFRMATKEQAGDNVDDNYEIPNPKLTVVEYMDVV